MTFFLELGGKETQEKLNIIADINGTNINKRGLYEPTQGNKNFYNECRDR